jgi:hypothetical protein
MVEPRKQVLTAAMVAIGFLVEGETQRPNMKLRRSPSFVGDDQ